jgi:hypothetical protein
LVVRLLPDVPVPDGLVPDVPVPDVPVPDDVLPGRVALEPLLLPVPGVEVLLRDGPVPWLVPGLDSVPVAELPLRPVMPLGTGTVRPSKVIICPLGSDVVSTRVARPLCMR